MGFKKGKIKKRSLTKYVFLLEVILFFWFSIFGESGFGKINRLNSDNDSLRQEALALKQQLQELEKEIKAWETNDFLKEKYAREHLQMAKEGDVIYFIK